MRSIDVAVVMVAHNVATTCAPLLESLCDQTFERWGLVVIDQASSDGTSDAVRTWVPHAVMLRNARNTGHAAGLNQAMRMAMGAFPSAWAMMVVDARIVLHRLCMERLVSAMTARRALSLVGPTIFQMFEENAGDESLHERVLSDVVYSTGLLWCDGKPVSHRDYGTRVTVHNGGDVFGVSWHGAMVRVRDVRRARMDEETYVDTTLGSEGEEVDLAWRLRHAGGEVTCVGEAHVYRACGVYRPQRRKVSAYRQLYDLTSSAQHVRAVCNAVRLMFVHVSLGRLVLGVPLWGTRQARWALFLLVYDRRALVAMMRAYVAWRFVFARRRMTKRLWTSHRKTGLIHPPTG